MGRKDVAVILATGDEGLVSSAYSSSTGAVGGGMALYPSMTLGCGTAGGNITTGNVTARDLLNIQRIATPLG